VKRFASNTAHKPRNDSLQSKLLLCSCQFLTSRIRLIGSKPMRVRGHQEIGRGRRSGHASSLKGYELPPTSGIYSLACFAHLFRPMRSTSARATRTFRPSFQLRDCGAQQTVKQSTLLTCKHSMRQDPSLQYIFSNSKLAAGNSVATPWTGPSV
jgi:hypothetical protein